MEITPLHTIDSVYHSWALHAKYMFKSFFSVMELYILEWIYL